MLSTKNLINDYKEIDSRWIFEYYAKLTEKLSGQSVKIKSIFNPNDKTPSLVIYVDKQKGYYRFKDFSTGKAGTSIDFIKELYGYSFHQAVTLLLSDYNSFVTNNGGCTLAEFRDHGKFQVSDHELRSWNTKDQYQWTQFNIGSTFLNEYCVKPMSSYTMSKTEDGETHHIVIKGDYIYGYFKKDGTLYKIYQPKNKEKKFIKVQDYIQGSEQLKGYDYLMITSGIKDTGSLDSLKLNLDYISPDSENTMIPQDMMIQFKKDYKKVLVMFDNDKAGIAAMKKYRETYGTPCVLLTLGKDVALATKTYGPKKVKERLVPLIDMKLCEL